MPMLPVLEETVDVVSLVPCGRVQQRTAEQIVDVPLFAEETVETVRLAPQERVQWIDEQMVEVPTPQITEKIGEEIVDVPTPASEALQLQVCAISKEIHHNMDSGYEEVLTETHELAIRLGECLKKI